MQIQNIRDFARNRLGDICGNHNQVQAYGECNRAWAGALMITRSGLRYQLQCRSPYADGNGTGLGEIMLKGPGNFELHEAVDAHDRPAPRQMKGATDFPPLKGPMRDETWAMMAKWVRDHEPDSAPQVAPTQTIQPPTPEPIPEPQSDGREPWLGMPVIFYPRSGERVSGVSEVAAIVTRVWSATVVDITTLAPNCEPNFYQKARRRVQPDDMHVWDFSDVWRMADIAEIRDLHLKLMSLQAQVDMLTSRISAPGQLAAMQREMMTAAGEAKENAEKEQLRAVAADLGIEVDKRWGIERLRAEIDAKQKVAQ